jgi:hypothetical protein
MGIRDIFEAVEDSCSCSLGAFSEAQVTRLDFPFGGFKVTPESFDHTL